MHKVDRNSPIPLYYQIAMDLRTRIKWEWGYGAKLPTEPELAEEYGTTRVTIRNALAELAEDGMLLRQRGKGTFVREEPKSLVHTLRFPMSFSSRFQIPGLVLSSQVLQAEIQKIRSSEIAGYLGLDINGEIAYFKRIFFVNDQPVAINRSILPDQLCPGITTSTLIDNSISTTLSNRYGLVPTDADEWLEAVLATEKEASLIRAVVGTPLLLVTTLSRLSDGTPVEYSMTLWNTERMRLHVHLSSAGNRSTHAE